MAADDTITDKRGRVACPVSLEHANLLSNYDVHFTAPSQVAKFGMCRKCRAKIKKNGKAILAGKVERPADWSKLHDLPIQPDDHIARDVGGAIVSTEDFDWNTVCERENDLDAMLGIISKAEPEAREQAAEVLQAIWQWLYARGGQTSLRLATAKRAVLISGLSPHTLDGATLEAMADELGVSKSAMSKVNITTQKRFSILFPRSRSLSARENMSDAAMGHGPTFKGKRNSRPLGSVGGGI